ASLYGAEEILNWRVERINGRNIPTMVVLHETVGTSPQRSPQSGEGEDAFASVVREQIRVLKLVDASQLGTTSPQPSPLEAERENAGRRREYGCMVELWQKVLPHGHSADGLSSEKGEWKLVE